MGNLERLAIGASSVCGVAGIGVFLNKSLSNDDIQSKLKANDFKILSKNDQYGTWGKILKVYKEVTEQKGDFKFSAVNVTTEKQLQEECEKVFKKRVGESNEQNKYYQKAKRWCTVPTVVSKVLEKDRKLLNTEKEKDDADKEDWDKKIKDYIAKTNENKIDGLDFGKEPIKVGEKKHREVIKPKCKELNEKKSYEEGYETALEKSKTWCTIEKKTVANK